MPAQTIPVEMMGKPLVLVVEDDPMTRTLSACLARAAGFDAILAGNADEAVSVLETHPDVRVVFTDVRMPGFMNGMQLAALVARRWPAIGVLITSAHADIADRDLPARSVFLRKPYSIREVMESLQRLSAPYTIGSSHCR
jgi:CheY-like chemotaxis protein